MASIDRYRPPREGYQPPAREGYQPPTVPPPSSSAAAPAARQDRRSRSPTKRRDVPPPAPSPPSHSSRTSPPKSQSRRGLQSPQLDAMTQSASAATAAPAPTEPLAPSSIVSQWVFTADEVKSTPSIVDGLSLAEERLRRAKGVNFIYQAGVLLDLPQITLWVAGVFFHRFYMRYSMVEEKGGVHHYNIAATSLFLANKTEENCRKTKDIIITVAKVAQKNAKLIIDEQSKEYWRWRDSILMYEELMLELLTFDLMVENPYHCLFGLLRELDIVHNKELRQSAWAFCNDCCLTSLPLLMDARDIAIASIFFASVHTNQQIDDVAGVPWWKVLRGDEDKCATAVTLMADFWEENPLKKQNPAISSPAFLLDNTRRRGGDALTSQQTGTPSSAAPTPLDLDGSTQSPGASRTNGGADRDGAGSSQMSGLGDLSLVREPRSPLLSPRKRKDVDETEDASLSQKKRRSGPEDGEDGYP